MSYRKCVVCNGTGVLHLTPFSLIDVLCWRCLGKKEVWEDDKQGGEL